MVVEVFVSVVEYLVQMLEQLAAAWSTGCANTVDARAQRRYLARCMVEVGLFDRTNS